MLIKHYLKNKTYLKLVFPVTFLKNNVTIFIKADGV